MESGEHRCRVHVSTGRRCCVWDQNLSCVCNHYDKLTDIFWENVEQFKLRKSGYNIKAVSIPYVFWVIIYHHCLKPHLSTYTQAISSSIYHLGQHCLEEDKDLPATDPCKSILINRRRKGRIYLILLDILVQNLSNQNMDIVDQCLVSCHLYLYVYKF